MRAPNGRFELAVYRERFGVSGGQSSAPTTTTEKI